MEQKESIQKVFEKVDLKKALIIGAGVVAVGTAAFLIAKKVDIKSIVGVEDVLEPVG